MLTEIRDFMDYKVDMVILVDTDEELSVIKEVFKSIELSRLKVCIHNIHISNRTKYVVEIRMPYNRYLKMMKGLISRGYNLMPQSNVDMINKMFKMEE